MDVSELSYSIKAITTVQVLEIGLIDFKDKMPPEILNELRHIALKKQFMKIIRMKDIAKTS